MRAAFVTSHLPKGRLVVGERPMPRPSADEVLVRVIAAAVNPVDWKMWNGMLRPALEMRFPQVLGLDVSGVVAQAPKGSRFSVGDEVFAATPRRPSTFAEHVAIPESALAHKPARIDHVQAASLPVAALTAWQALHEIARVRPGERVFVQAGGGGFGSIAVQVAAILGASVTTTASARHHALLSRLGVDRIIDYTSEDYARVAGEHDVAVESLDAEVERTLGIVRAGGRFVSVVGPADRRMLEDMGLPGPLAWAVGGVMRRKIAARAARRGISYDALYVRADGAQLARIAELVDARRLVPNVGATYALDDVGRAIELVHSGRAAGKVVIRVAV
jgi:NADPH:quinone reductase-like Zn-dependent oxidoreductase